MMYMPQSAKKVTEELPIAARRSNTMLRWQQPNHSFRILVDIWSIDEITVYKRPVKYNLQFSYTTGCITNTSEYVINVKALHITSHFIGYKWSIFQVIQTVDGGQYISLYHLQLVVIFKVHICSQCNFWQGGYTRVMITCSS